MEKTKKSFKKLCLLIVFSCLLLCCSIASIFTMKHASAATFAIDIVETNGITLTTGEMDASNSSLKTGMLFSGTRKGANATFNRTFSGKLDMEFDLPQNAISNLAFIFESTNGDSFSLHYVTGTQFTGFYVEVNGEKAGINSSRQEGLGLGLNNTAVNNSQGKYTVVTGKNIYFSFNANDMTIYAGASMTSETLVWDFSKEYNDKMTIGTTFDPFVQYNVSIVFEELQSKDEGKFLLYEVNGTKLDSALIQNAKEPRIGINTLWKPVAGEEYKIPQPYAVTMLNDDIKSTDIKVRAMQGGKEIFAEQLWTDKLSVVFNSNEECMLIYSVVNNGVKTEETFTAEVISRAKVENKWTYSKDLNDFYNLYLGKGATITLPVANYTSSIYEGKNVLNATVTVLLDGKEIEGATSNANEEQLFTFEKSGKYTISFNGVDSATKAKETFDFYISDRLPILSYTGLKANYAYNETISLPTNVKISYDGESVEAVRRVIYPSGASYYNTNVTLDEAGAYKVVYSAQIDGVGYSLEEKFVVYAKNTDLFYNASDRGNLNLSSAGSYLDESERGVFVSATSGTVIQYANVIDLTNMKQGDTFIDLKIVPDALKDANFTVLKVRLTDIYDENNYIEIKCKDATLNNAGGCMYIQAGANGQKLGGIASGSTFTTEAATYCGYTTMTSFRATSDSSLGLSMDYAERKIYCSTDWMLLVDNNPRYCITDLDNTDYYAKAWNGFTTGECYLSLIPEGIVSSANMVIKSVAGIDLSDDVVADMDAPEVEVVYDGVAELPMGIVGVEYPLPTLKVNDIHETNVSIRVYSIWYDWFNEIMVENNKFVPDREGKYAIVYTAEDVYGNVTQKLEYIDVKSSTEISPIELKLSPGYSMSGIIGMPISIASAEYKNGMGYTKLFITAENEKGELIELDDLSFVPQTAGVWTITYHAYDYFGDERAVEISYEVAIALNEEPVWDEMIVLPPLFIDGYTYQLPLPNAYDYRENVNNPTILTPKITVTDGKGTYELTDGNYVPSVKAHGSEIKIVYQWGNEGDSVRTETFNIKGVIVGENGSLDISKYFDTNNMSITLGEISSEFLATGKNASATFGRELIADGLSFWFNIDKEKNNFDAVNVYLKDSVDANNVIKVTIQKRAEGANAVYLSINDGELRTGAGSFFGESLINLGISYSEYSKEIFDGSGAVVAIIENTLYGEKFNGFESGKVYLSFELVNVTGTSAITVKTINGQYICSTQEDTVRPGMVLLGDLGGTFDPNAEVEIPALLVGDVLSEIASVTVSVVGPDGKAVNAIDSTLLSKASAERNYFIKLTQVGTYKVQYMVTDTAGFRQMVEKSILVPDVKAPTVVINGKIPMSAKVGDKITIPKFTATDDFSEEVTCYVIVMTPTSYATVTTANQIELTSAGKWLIRYFVYDSYYNCTIIDYEIIVK